MACLVPANVFLGLLLLPGTNILSQQDQAKLAATNPLRLVHQRAHSHNDYYQKRPFLDAVKRGFGSVEADVFLHRGRLKVAHTFFEIKTDVTLENLYLKPLSDRIRKNGGFVHRKGTPFRLLIDFKTSGTETLAALEATLEKYREILTRLENGKVIEAAVVIYISGNRPVEEIRSATDRLVFLDGRLSENKRISKTVSPLVSESWNSHFKYRGFGEMPILEQKKLEQILKDVHSQGKIIRFWALPDRPTVWKLAFESGIDLINTDKLDELSSFLSNREQKQLGEKN